MDTFCNFLGITDKSDVSDLVKYHGLVNQGATCFLNSVLQLLFMTPDFRERVKSVTRSNPDTEHIDRELSDLFFQLEGDIGHTNNITNKLKIHNVREQRDAAELFERILRLTSPGASQIFHGELTNRIKCEQCARVTESAAGFWNLPLPLMGSSDAFSVERGIEAFFRPSLISGDDQMYCEKCDEKCNAILDCVVKHHPEVLVLLIKRFEFDFSQRKYVKISCVADIPLLLHVQNQTYELYGIIEHLNEQRFGRYIANIKSQFDGKWYTFDDSNVTVSRHQYFQTDHKEKSRTAYLLFYQRRTANMYNGLLNVGATCFLNSILQVLFMTDNFKQSVTRHSRSTSRTEYIDCELGDLFSDLERHCAYTYNIIKKLKINNVYEQRDAAEHYEKVLRLSSPESSQIFHGELHHKNTCLKCRAQTESTTGFWLLPLSLLDSQDTYSVHKSIQDFFYKEVQVYCEKCDQECATVLECDLQHQPDVLVILLKRFEYDHRRRRHVKNSREVEVPSTLLMPQTYGLYACVEHFGELTFGHYIARIRSQVDGRWYVFDDMKVSVTHNHFQEHPMERSQTAYLLFYQKQKDTLSDDTSETKASTRETQASDSMATRNAEDRMEEGESPRRVTETSDETKQSHEETRTELHHSGLPDLDLDRLTDSLHKMAIGDNEESMFPQDEALESDDIGDRSRELVKNTNVNSCIEFGEIPADIKDYRLKVTLRQKDFEDQGRRDKERAGSEGSAEKTAPPQPYNIHYPDAEDFRRVQATKVFIRNEELDIEGTELRKRSQTCAARFEGVESLGVTEDGDTETLRFKPKKRQDNDHNTSRRETTGSSPDPETTRHSTIV